MEKPMAVKHLRLGEVRAGGKLSMLFRVAGMKLAPPISIAFMASPEQDGDFGGHFAKSCCAVLGRLRISSHRT